MRIKELKLPKLAYNWISALGIIIAFVTTLLMTFLYLIGIWAKVTNPYLGIFLYMALPPILFFGLFLIPVGMFRQWRIMKKTGKETYANWPYIDLNKRSHRNASAIFLIGSFVLLIISSVGGYEAYHFSESVTFCGKVCHQVMKPEYTAYQNSPHARVACVECHVGPGADWFAKSKISGLYQVYAVLADKYPRPIPTPIKSLRPARETCEQCHWPEKFFGAQQRLFDHYMYNKENSHRPISMLVKIGGGSPKRGKVSGIHWHMFIGKKIEYIARDEAHMDIPWIKAIDLSTERTIIYEDEENPLTEEEKDTAMVHVMDCMDCHNRPSHIYNSPDLVIDEAISTGQISGQLPEIKRIAVEALSSPYDSEDAARLGIANKISEFYRNTYPDIYRDKINLIDRAILAAQDRFYNNIFPGMKVSWNKYPDNIGHFYSPGCMRCHDGKHITKDGDIISRDCSNCHVILSQSKGDQIVFSSSPDGLKFEHPEDIDEAWQEIGCYECHTGTQP